MVKRYERNIDMNDIVNIESVSKIYKTNTSGRVLALDRFSMSIPENQLTVMIGQTGCGKTTLLNIIAGFDQQFSGTVEYGKKGASQLIVSCVFQHYTLFPWRNIINNVAFSLEMQGVKREKRFSRAEELLNKVNLSGIEKNYPHELSGGMRQRVAIAQALAKKPDLLLLDEPFGALDDGTRRELQKVFLNLMKTESITALLVTHNIEEALMMGDRILVMSPAPGRIVAEHKLKTPHPRNPLAKDFVELFTNLRREIAVGTD
jgi:NitT/TauT family transport system ATP-binding protein